MNPTVARLLAQRDAFAARGDMALVVECNRALARLGYSEAETAVAPVEMAVPRRGPGRPRKNPVV